MSDNYDQEPTQDQYQLLLDLHRGSRFVCNGESHMFEFHHSVADERHYPVLHCFQIDKLGEKIPRVLPLAKLFRVFPPENRTEPESGPYAYRRDETP